MSASDSRGEHRRGLGEFGVAESGKPLVTIAIPTFNRARSYLPRALEGALSQTYENLEIIVADNGSTDDTETVVKSYGDSRIRYFRQERNITPNDNFNFCLSQARGDYLLLLLDDEQVDSDLVETCLRAAGYQRDVGLIRTAVRVVDADGRVVRGCVNGVSGLPLDEFFLAWFENRTTIYLCGTLFNAEELRNVGGFRSRHNLFQDVMAHVRIAARARRVDVDAVKASTRRHPGQGTYAVRVRAWCEDSLDLLELMCQLAPSNKSVIRSRGMWFFAGINYDRATPVEPLIRRLVAFWDVYRLFDRQRFPSLHAVVGGTAVYRGLRSVKRTLREAARKILADKSVTP